MGKRTSPQWIPPQPIFFYDLVGSAEKKDKKDPSKYNLAEVEFIAQLYRLFEWDRLTGLSIGIITPYRRQVKEIRSAFDRNYGEAYKQNVQINTVDSF